MMYLSETEDGFSRVYTRIEACEKRYQNALIDVSSWPDRDLLRQVDIPLFPLAAGFQFATASIGHAVGVGSLVDCPLFE